MGDHEESGDGIALPASFETVWGVRARPAKGPRRGLSLERIVEAAINVAVADGLEAVSMSRVAADLGSAPMSLYRYVASKSELLDLMADAALGRPPEPSAPGEGWRPGLARWAWAERAVIQRHTWWLRIPIGGPPVTPNQVAWLEHGLRCLAGTGLAENEKMSVILLVSGYVRNEVTLMADIESASRASGLDPGQVMPAYGRTLTKLIDRDRFPALHRVIDAGVMDADDGPDDEFVFGLERILDGVDVLVRAREPGR
jgi:AcrR family transcriptional regulator